MSWSSGKLGEKEDRQTISADRQAGRIWADLQARWYSADILLNILMFYWIFWYSADILPACLPVFRQADIQAYQLVFLNITSVFLEQSVLLNISWYAWISAGIQAYQRIDKLGEHQLIFRIFNITAHIQADKLVLNIRYSTSADLQDIQHQRIFRQTSWENIRWYLYIQIHKMLML